MVKAYLGETDSIKDKTQVTFKDPEHVQPWNGDEWLIVRTSTGDVVFQGRSKDGDHLRSIHEGKAIEFIRIDGNTVRIEIGK